MKRLDYLDALRGMAALLVVLQHVLERTSPDTWLVQHCNIGILGVLLFFMISGFIVPSSIKGDRPVQRFAISRAARLLPALWVSVAIMVMLDGGTVPQIAANMVMLAGPLGYQPFSGIYWTLTYELGFYVLCVVLYLAGALQNPRVVGSLLLCCVGLTLATVQNILFPAYMLLGLLLRLDLVLGDPRARAWTRPCAALLVVLGATYGWLVRSGNPVSDGWPRMVAMVLAVPLFWAIIRWRPAPARFLVYLGTISYSVYLFHDPVFRLVEALRPAHDGIFALLVLPGSIAAGALAYRLVELPFINLGRRTLQRSHLPAATLA